MKESYLTPDFRKTAAERFPAETERLNAAFDARLGALRAEYAGAGKEKLMHLERQIMPGIAAYETFQAVMDKDEALRTVHGCVEQRAQGEKKSFVRLLRMPLTPDCSPNGRPRPDALFFPRAARKSVDRSRACWISTASWSSFSTTGTTSSSTSSPRSTSSRSAR